MTLKLFSDFLWISVQNTLPPATFCVTNSTWDICSILGALHLWRWSVWAARRTFKKQRRSNVGYDLWNYRSSREWFTSKKCYYPSFTKWCVILSLSLCSGCDHQQSALIIQNWGAAHGPKCHPEVVASRPRFGHAGPTPSLLPGTPPRSALPPVFPAGIAGEEKLLCHQPVLAP